MKRLLQVVFAGIVPLLGACDSSTSPDTRNLPTPIMFQSVRNSVLGLYLTSVDGRRVVTFDGGNNGDRTGDWSPDGRQIVFTRIFPRVQVWLANADGSNMVQLTHSTGDSNEPRWMPNGASISYWNNDDPFGVGINSINLDGSNPRRLSNTLDAAPGYNWSPDGRVVFAKYEAYQVPGTNEYLRVTNLYIADTIGTAPVRLTSTTECGDTEPEWSPDGSRIVFASCTGTRSSIVVIAPDGTGRVTLTSGDGFDSHPTWSPDGGQIAFQRGGGSNSSDVWVMSANGSNPVNITANNPEYDGAPKWNRVRRLQN